MWILYIATTYISHLEKIKAESQRNKKMKNIQKTLKYLFALFIGIA